LTEKYNKSEALEMELEVAFLQSIKDTGISFPHRNQENVSLEDFFVFPDLKVIKESIDDIQTNLSGEEVLQHSERIIIFGDEQSGKTTFAKRLFLDAYKSGLLPVFIEGGNVRNSNAEGLVRDIIGQTYPNASVDEYLKKDNIICIIDDISSTRINKKSTNKFIERISTIFPRSIVFANDILQFTYLDFSALDDYLKLEILPFGNVRRGSLIEKWVESELTEEADEQVFWARIDQLRLHVDSLVYKNIVPAKPFYILMLLQSFELITVQRLELTSYGHCYQYLIYQALERAQVKHNEIDTYLNVLSEMGGKLLDSPTESFDSNELEAFFTQYSNDFLPVNKDKVVEDLVKSSVLRKTDIGIKFRYRYLFYFFAAKNLADSLSKGDSAKDKIRHLINSIHLEKSSNIVLFLTHHSKDPWVIDEILYSVMEIFSGEEEATLEAQSLSFLKDFIKEIPEIVMENRRDAKHERLEIDKKKDLIEQQESSNQINDDNSNIEDTDLSEFIEKVNKAFRVTEVCGQILRNRIGSLERRILESIYEESLLVTLRFLNLLLKSSEYMQDEVIRKIQRMLDQSPDISNQEVEKKAETFYFTLNFLAILALLNRTAFSLGSFKGREIYLKVTEDKKTPALQLIQEIIELQFEKKLDVRKIEKIHSDFSGNPLCDRLLKQIILRHCYLHDIGFRDRQKLADKLNIPIQRQRSILLASKSRS
jgi:GTPase SAR1 family protein